MKKHAVQVAAAETVRGCVDTVYYAAPHWSSGRLVTPAGTPVRFSGNLFARVGDPLVLRGSWRRHPQYGRQFEVAAMEYDLALDRTGLAHYLANHPDVKGIGPVKARLLAERFGDDFENALFTQPSAMAEAARVPVEVILKLRDVWRDNALLNRASAWLSSFELTHHQVSSLLKRLGNNAVAILKENPYLLVREVPGFGFKRVDQIARNMGIRKDHPGRIRAGVLDCIASAMNSGHCWVDRDELIDEAIDLLTMDHLDSHKWVKDAIHELINEGALVCVVDDEGFEFVADPRLFNMERVLGEVFTIRRPNVYFAGEGNIDAIVGAQAPELNHGQRDAVHNALTRMMSLISGGAGSGKTYTVNAILTICKARGLSVSLAAPTGKAAKRMEQVTGHPASTIHRLLGYNGESWVHGPQNPLRTDVLLVDEFSMVDVPLAWRLFTSLELSRTMVVLVGDHNQLPPVGPGNVLRDLVQRRLLPTVVLEEIVRQAGVLKENSIAILSGRVPKTSERDATGARAWYLFDDLSNPAHIPRFICDMYGQVLAQKLGYDLIRDVQVLTPTHKGPMGTRALNITLQRLLQKMLFDVDVPPVPEGKRPRPLVYDKVIQTRNNYDLDVMNGAVGVVIEAPSKGGLTIDFDGDVVKIPGKSAWLKDIELAFCLSIHKSQGSEYPCVVTIIHKAHTFQHHRNLFYTAVTRAKHTAIILGDAWGIRECARKRSMELRQTFLSLQGDLNE